MSKTNVWHAITAYVLVCSFASLGASTDVCHLSRDNVERLKEYDRCGSAFHMAACSTLAGASAAAVMKGAEKLYSKVLQIDGNILRNELSKSFFYVEKVWTDAWIEGHIKADREKVSKYLDSFESKGVPPQMAFVTELTELEEQASDRNEAKLYWQCHWFSIAELSYKL
ncbi:MAG: hypothetical protein KDD61_14110 [Bdellovibrionales bacterium]|nr:hypothetical protein [Bdellovibrionales bacterium]